MKHLRISRSFSRISLEYLLSFRKHDFSVFRKNRYPLF